MLYLTLLSNRTTFSQVTPAWLTLTLLLPAPSNVDTAVPQFCAGAGWYQLAGLGWRGDPATASTALQGAAPEQVFWAKSSLPQPSSFGLTWLQEVNRRELG